MISPRWHAGRMADYWRARLDWQSALEIAQKYGIGDSASFPEPREIETRYEFVDKWRAAVVKQLLTPAPDGAAVTWKRAQLAGIGFSHLPTKAERIERVIATTSRSSPHTRPEPRKAGHHEAPPPIDQKAQPPAHYRSRKTAEAVTANRGRGLRSAPSYCGETGGPGGRQLRRPTVQAL